MKNKNKLEQKEMWVEEEGNNVNRIPRSWNMQNNMIKKECEYVIKWIGNEIFQKSGEEFAFLLH